MSVVFCATLYLAHCASVFKFKKRSQKKLQYPVVDYSFRLPFELLSYIFEYVVAEQPPGNLRWSSVMLVCRRWYTIVIGTPKLWTTIACPECLEDRWVLPLLKRSRELPLSIRLYRDKTLYTPSYFSRNTFYKLVTALIQNPSDMARLQNIYIRTDLPHDTYTVERCLDKFRLPAPALRVFRLDTIHYKAELSLKLFGGVTPGLREVILKTRVGLLPTHPLLRDLTYLHLQFTNHRSWSVGQTLAVLAACPSLTSLALVGVLSDTPSDPSTYPVDTITLPLRLFVFDASETALRSLIGRLASLCPTVMDGTISENRTLDFISPNISPTTPDDPLTSLFVSLTSGGDHIIGYPESVDPSLDLRPAFSPLAKDRRRDVRDFDDERQSKLPSTDTNPRLFLFDMLFDRPHVDVPELVLASTHPQTNTVRWLFIKVDKPRSAPAISDKNTWRRLFESMPQVERLSIRAKDRFMDPALAALLPDPSSASDLSRSCSDSTVILLPKLRTLELCQWAPHQEVREDSEPGTSFLEDGESIRRLLEIIKARQSHSAPISSLVVSGKEVSRSDMQSLLRIKLD